MLTVYKFVGDWGLPDLSPFVIKLETWLRLTGIAYRTQIGNPGQGPKQKLPYVDDDGQIVADSTLIIEHLTRTRGVDLDAHLGPRERALATAVQAMLEEHHYFIIMYTRWCPDAGMATYYPTMLRYCAEAGIPAEHHAAAIAAARVSLSGQAHAQGVARHSDDEIMAIGQRHWTAVSTLLGDQPLILGDRPTTLDATVYAFLVSVIGSPFDNPIKAHALAQANLVAYADRMRAAYWA